MHQEKKKQVRENYTISRINTEKFAIEHKSNK